MILAWFNQRLNLEVLRDVRETTRTTAYIFAIFLGATAYSGLRGLRHELISGFLNGLPFGATGILISILFFVLLGFFLDWIEITLIVLPLVSPVVLGLGFDLVWFTVLFEFA